MVPCVSVAKHGEVLFCDLSGADTPSGSCFALDELPRNNETCLILWTVTISRIRPGMPKHSARFVKHIFKVPGQFKISCYGGSAKL